MDIEFYKMRLDGVSEAATRSRRVLAISLIASLAEIGVLWNFYLSWMRDFVLPDRVRWPSNEIVTLLQQEALKNWVESNFVSVSLLGIRFSVTDISEIGSLGLLILAVWLFYSARRENHLIASTAQCARDEPARMRAFVFHGVMATQLFTSLSDSDQPIEKLEEPNTRPAARRVFLVRGLVDVLILLPALAIAASFAGDIWSVTTLPAIYRYPHEPLTPKFDENWQRLLASGIVAAFGTYLLFRVLGYQRSTKKLLRHLVKLGWAQIEPEPSASGNLAARTETAAPEAAASPASSNEPT